MLTQPDGYTPEYVAIGQGILDDLGRELALRGMEPAAAFLIGDESVDAHYGDRVASALQESGWQVARRTVPAGEESKSVAAAEQLWRWLLQCRAERSDLIVALGGGVVGDLAGFVAATWGRGIAWAQVATTLLAQVDSSIGGKVAVDLPGGKNMVGAFHNPVLSLLDTQTLQTLPQRDLASGWVEAIKHGIIRDAAYLAELERGPFDLRDPEMLELAVRNSVRHQIRGRNQRPLRPRAAGGAQLRPHGRARDRDPRPIPPSPARRSGRDRDGRRRIHLDQADRSRD